MRTVDEPVLVSIALLNAPILAGRPRLVADTRLDECGGNGAEIIADFSEIFPNFGELL